MACQEAMIGIVETEEKSQKDRGLTTSKTKRMLVMVQDFSSNIRLMAEYGHSKSNGKYAPHACGTYLLPIYGIFMFILRVRISTC